MKDYLRAVRSMTSAQRHDLMIGGTGQERPDGGCRPSPLRSGGDRADERWEEGTSGYLRWLLGKRTVLEGAAA